MDLLHESKFDIIILAGQSNAEGFGQGKDESVLPLKAAYQLDDGNPATLTVDTNNPMDVTLNIVKPYDIVFSEYKERFDKRVGSVADFSETFVKSYVEKGYLKEDRKVLVVKSAAGGTGFARHEWGLGSKLYERLVFFTEYALSLNKENKLVAFLWHQGEHDAFENAHFNAKERFDFYYSNLKAQTEDYRTRFGNVPFICGGFVDGWANLPEHKKQCIAVCDALKQVCKDLGSAEFTRADGLKNNAEEVGDLTDKAHFSRKSCYELGYRYFDNFEKIINKR